MTTATAIETKNNDAPFSYAAAASGKSKSIKSGPATPAEPRKPSESTKPESNKETDASGSSTPIANGEPITQSNTDASVPSLVNGTMQTAKSPKLDSKSPRGDAINKEEDVGSIASGQEGEASVASNEDGDGKSSKDAGSEGKGKFKAQNLIDAPIPKQNPWTMRREAFDRTKAQQGDMKKSQPLVDGTSSHDKTSQAPSNERRHNRQKSMLAENRQHQQAPGRRDGNISTDRRAAPDSGKDGKISTDETNRGSRQGRSAKGQQDDSNNRESSAPPPAPPSLTDPSFWPTPDDAQVAQDEEKREKRERDDKEKPVVSARPTKDKWISVPVTPNIIYETPLPSRGGRGGRGGRADRGGRNAQPSNRPPRDIDTSTAPADSAPVANADKPRTTQSLSESRGHQNPTSESRIRVPGTLNSPANDNLSGETSGKKDLNEILKKDAGGLPLNGVTKSNEGLNSESSEKDGKVAQTQDDGAFVGQGVLPPAIRPKADKTGTFQNSREHQGGHSGRGGYQNSFSKQDNNEGNHSSHIPRDRPSGRGNYRGGRGDSTYTSHPNSRFNGGNSIRHHSPPSQINTNPHQHRQSPQYPSSPSTPQTARSYRGNSRSQNVQQTQQYGKYGVQNGFQQQQQQQQQQSGYVQSPTFPYPYYNNNSRNGLGQAMPFQPDYEFTASVQNVMNQLAYYFSLDNMVKDTFLRGHMDSQGWIFLEVIAGFRKVKDMSKDNINIVREACVQSPLVEFRGYHPDGHERLRAANNPTEWILKYEDRDESCRNEGPYWDPRYVHTPQFINPAVYPMYFQNPNMPPMPVPGPSDQQFPAYNGYHQGAQFMPTFVPGQEFVPENGAAYGNGFMPPYQPFVPGQEVKGSGANPLDEGVPQNDHKGGRSHKKYPTVDEFPDGKVNQLVLVTRQVPSLSLNGEGQAQASNVKVTDQLNEALIKLEKNADGGNESQKGKDNDDLVKFYPTSPRLGPAPAPQSSNDEVGWFVDPGASEESGRAPSITTFRLFSYPEFKNNVLGRREEVGAANVPELDILYRFYSHFLRKHFNLNMYNEFKSLALEDFHNKSSSGVEYLYKFHVFKIHDFPTPDLIFQDFASLASEQNEKPPYDKKMVDSVGFSKSITSSTKTRLGKFMQEKNKNFQMWPVHYDHRHHHNNHGNHHNNHHGNHHNTHNNHGHGHGHQNVNHAPNGPSNRN